MPEAYINSAASGSCCASERHMEVSFIKGRERYKNIGFDREKPQIYNYMFQVPDDYNYTASTTR